MKLNENTVEVLSNVKAEKAAFSISTNAQDTALAIDVITNKGYKHKIQTPVQEYICNARDAHREAGQTRPIEITLPTVFDPIFKVRDFGLGIDPSKMNDVFIKFFASTKRRDNSQTGGFGLGAKSAWAYTDSFGIVSIVGGIKRTYTAYKAGQGMLQPEGEVKTDEPSGVEISIAVNPKDMAEFKKAVIRTVFFWKESERPVLVNEATPISYPKEPRRFGRFAFYDNSDIQGIVSTDRYYNRDYVILDGVPYEIEDVFQMDKDLDRYNRKVCRFFLELETGEVSITPFRESLEYNELTTNSLNEKIKTSKNLLEKAYNSALKKAKTGKEKIEVLKSFEGCLNLDTLKLNELISYRYNNLAMTMGAEEWKKFSFNTWNGDKLQPFYRKGSYVRDCQLSVNTIFIEYDPSVETDSERTTRMKFVQYCKAQGKKNNNRGIVLVSFTKESQYIKEAIEEIFGLVCSTTLKYEKVAVERAERTKREDFETTDLADGKIVRQAFDDEQLENHFYVYASEYQSNKYEMERLAQLLKGKKAKLLSIQKADEKHILKKGAKKLQDNLNMIQLSSKDLLGFLASYEGLEYRYLVPMKPAFTNKAVIAYIDQLEASNKVYNEKNDGDYYHYNRYNIELMKVTVEANSEYKKLLTIQAEGRKLIKERFYLLEKMSNVDVSKEVLEEIKEYVKTKEKQGE